MDLDKRKREADDGDDEEKKMMPNKKRITEPEEDDEEVEEFFAILRRIRVALKYFERADGSGRSFSTAKAWEPSFLADDFKGDDGEHKAGVNVKDLTADSSGLDLNSEPAPSRRNNTASFH